MLGFIDINFIKDELIDGRSLELIYRGTRDGFKFSDFHAKCDFIPNTLTVIKSEHNKIFGGYTSMTWDGQGQKTDPSAFIFSITN